MNLTDEELNELQEYADLDGTEVGDLVSCLLSLDPSYFMTTDMKTALQNELREQLQNFRDYATIEERTETITRTIKELNWS